MSNHVSCDYLYCSNRGTSACSQCRNNPDNDNWRESAVQFAENSEYSKKVEEDYWKK